MQAANPTLNKSNNKDKQLIQHTIKTTIKVCNKSNITVIIKAKIKVSSQSNNTIKATIKVSS